MAVGSVVPCDGVNHALTCHSTSDSLVLAANRTASSIAGRPSSARRKSDGPRLYRTTTAVTSSFARRVDVRTSGSLRSNSDVSLSERSAVSLECFVPSGRRCIGCAARFTTLCAELVDEAWPPPLLQTLLTMLEQNWTSHHVCVQAGACACLFARPVWIDSGSWTELVQVPLRFLLTVGECF